MNFEEFKTKLNEVLGEANEELKEEINKVVNEYGEALKDAEEKKKEGGED